MLNRVEVNTTLLDTSALFWKCDDVHLLNRLSSGMISISVNLLQWSKEVSQIEERAHLLLLFSYLLNRMCVDVRPFASNIVLILNYFNMEEDVSIKAKPDRPLKEEKGKVFSDVRKSWWQWKCVPMSLWWFVLTTNFAFKINSRYKNWKSITTTRRQPSNILLFSSIIDLFAFYAQND